jgi:hypothetical protein
MFFIYFFDVFLKRSLEGEGHKERERARTSTKKIIKKYRKQNNEKLIT